MENDQTTEKRWEYYSTVADGSEVSYGLCFGKNGHDDTVSFLSGHTVCREDYYCHFGNPKHYCLMYFSKGKGRLRHGNNTYTPKTGDLFILHPFTEWEYETDPKNPWELYWFNINDTFGKYLFLLYDLTETVQASFPPVREYMQNIFMSFSNYKRTDSDIRDDAVPHLFRLLQTLSREKDTAGTTKQARDVAAMRRYIQEHLGESISSREVSASVFRSHSSAATLFRQATGCSIKNYIIKEKLAAVARLLSDSTIPIWKIASDFSFYDTRHLAHAFTVAYGVSPSVYRKRALEEKPIKITVTHVQRCETAEADKQR